MSTNYTTIRLWWDGRRGQAQCDGVVRDLTVAPDVPLMPEMTEIDYCPELHTFLVRRHAYDRLEDMEPPERAAVRSWLAGFAAAIKRRFA